MISKLKYGNTNTFFINGSNGGLLIDTDYAGTINSFFKETKKHDIRICDITYILATHYHPDHIGLISELMEYGIKLLVVDSQRNYIGFADEIFFQDRRLQYKPINIDSAIIISSKESRAFLAKIGINGEIIYTQSHSPDSISLILDDGSCFVGDLEPISYLDAYPRNNSLSDDWQLIMRYDPKIVYYGHANEKTF